MTMKKGQPLILILMLYESNSMWKEGSAAAGFKHVPHVALEIEVYVA